MGIDHLRNGISRIMNSVRRFHFQCTGTVLPFPISVFSFVLLGGLYYRTYTHVSVVVGIERNGTTVSYRIVRGAWKAAVQLCWIWRNICNRRVNGQGACILVILNVSRTQTGFNHPEIWKTGLFCFMKKFPEWKQELINAWHTCLPRHSNCWLFSVLHQVRKEERILLN